MLLTDKQKKLLTLLANGEFHSGTVLADGLGISRAAVCKNLTQLAELLGLNLMAVRGKGYRLDSSLELLSLDKIMAALNEQSQALIHSLEIFHQIDSTNRYLVELARLQAVSGRVCFAEQQTAGKGRRGRGARWPGRGASGRTSRGRHRCLRAAS